MDTSRYHKEYKKPTPEQRRASRLKRTYGLTIEQYDAMWASQGQGCAICQSTTKPSVDHDHACCPGKVSCGRCVRAILCYSCNMVLGMVQDDPERLRKIADWIDQK